MDDAQLRRGLARLIVSSWKDENYKRQAIIDPHGSLAALGVDLPPGLDIRVVEDTDKVKHVILGDKPLDEGQVVSSLSSSPTFYEAYAYAYEEARKNPWFKLFLMRHPTETFLRLGVHLPVDGQIEVHENTGAHRVFALPQPPAQMVTTEALAQAAASTATSVNANVNVNANVQANTNVDVNVNGGVQVNGVAVGTVAVGVVVLV